MTSVLDEAVSPESLRAILDNALQGADDGELFAERSRSESFLWDDGRLKSATYDSDQGFGLRVVAGEATGYAHASEISEAAIKRAADSAAAVKRGHSGVLALSPARTNRKLYGDVDPLAAPSFTAKTDLLQEIDAYVRAKDPRVVQVTVSLAGGRREIDILRTGGELYKDIRPLVRLNVSVTCEQNGRRENGSSGAGGRAEYEQWIAPERWRAIADEALRSAIVNLDSIADPAGEMDV
ncbi:MAG: DNA gyrase modulator, partial [Caulobacterales bacterium]